jgi:hypothetical protein
MGQPAIIAWIGLPFDALMQYAGDPRIVLGLDLNDYSPILGWLFSRAIQRSD